MAEPKTRIRVLHGRNRLGGKGSVVDLPAAEAAKWIKKGCAEKVTGTEKGRKK